MWLKRNNGSVSDTWFLSSNVFYSCVGRQMWAWRLIRQAACTALTSWRLGRHAQPTETHYGKSQAAVNKRCSCVKSFLQAPEISLILKRFCPKCYMTRLGLRLRYYLAIIAALSIKLRRHKGYIKKLADKYSAVCSLNSNDTDYTICFALPFTLRFI